MDTLVAYRPIPEHEPSMPQSSRVPRYSAGFLVCSSDTQIRSSAKECRTRWRLLVERRRAFNLLNVYTTRSRAVRWPVTKRRWFSGHDDSVAVSK